MNHTFLSAHVQASLLSPHEGDPKCDKKINGILYNFMEYM